jgi:hypothetical protein
MEKTISKRGGFFMKLIKNKWLSGSIAAIVFGLLILSIADYTNNHKMVPSRENKAIEASSSFPLMDSDWSVKYRVKKQGIYFENVITRFSFQQQPGQNNGYIAVFIDGKWKMNVHHSIFILKQVSAGKHKVTLQLKKKNGSDYGLKKNIVVTVR